MTMTPIFEGFVLLELLGRRQLTGMAQEVDMLGTRVLRLDVSLPEGEAPQVSFYPVAGVFGIHPISDEDAAAGADENLRTLRQMGLRPWPKLPMVFDNGNSLVFHKEIMPW